MRIRLITGLAVGLALGAAAPAAAGVPCGPAGARTLASGPQARVYVMSGDLVGCHRSHRRAARPLGARGPVRLVSVAGRYAAVARRRAGGRGDRLTVHDLRRNRRVGAYTAERGGSVVRMRLDPAGVAAHIVAFPAAGRRPARAKVGATDDPFFPLGEGPDVGRGLLGLAGSAVLWRRGPYLEVSGLESATTAPGVLLRRGGLEIRAAGGALRLRLDGGRWVAIPGARSICLSGSSGCGGTDALRRAGGFVAVRGDQYDPGYRTGDLRIVDLAAGTARVVHTTSGPNAAIHSFVVTRSGATAFAVVEPASGEAGAPEVRRVRTPGAVLDEGPGIDLESVRVRGGSVVWTNRGAERSAPLPAP